MDAITKSVLNQLSKMYPSKAIALTHQFLDGTEGKACGFVPSDCDGTAVKIEGQWWTWGEKK